MTYQIEISNRAVKQLKKLSTDIRERINKKILDLAKNLGQTHLKYKNPLIARVSAFFNVAYFFIKIHAQQGFQKSRAFALAKNPRPSGVVKLENTDNKYRIRVGNYRVLYEIKDDVLIIKVIRVGHRRDVYQDE